MHIWPGWDKRTTPKCPSQRRSSWQPHSFSCTLPLLMLCCQSERPLVRLSTWRIGLCYLRHFVLFLIVINNRHRRFLVGVYESDLVIVLEEGIDESARKRFLMLSTLSSSLPLVCPRLSSRSSSTSSVVVKKITAEDKQTLQRSSVHIWCLKIY